MMVVKQAIPCQAADVNQSLTSGDAAAFKAAGIDAILRYIPRTPALIPGNATAEEVKIILAANLLLDFVQHVAEPGWNPTAELGEEYGAYAAEYVHSIGIPPGPVLWCDLEEVAAGTTAQAVKDYVSSWAAAVTAAGYVPGLYVGWNIVLTDQELWDLPVKHYWKAYNCDQFIPNRGWQIIQEPEKSLPHTYVIYDPNTIQADNLGGLPIFLSPS